MLFSERTGNTKLSRQVRGKELMRRSVLKSMSAAELAELRNRVEALLSAKIGKQGKRLARKSRASRRKTRTPRSTG